MSQILENQYDKLLANLSSPPSLSLNIINIKAFNNDNPNPSPHAAQQEIL